MISMGIDPGQKGALAIIKEDKIIFCEPHPFIGEEMNISQIGQNILKYVQGEDRVLIALEKVNAMPKQGVCSVFNFGENYGELRGLLKYLKIPFIEPRPQKWKKVVLEGFDWKGDKEVSCDFVMKKHPYFNLVLPRCRKAHDGMADAICMAEYAAMQQK